MVRMWLRRYRQARNGRRHGMSQHRAALGEDANAAEYPECGARAIASPEVVPNFGQPFGRARGIQLIRRAGAFVQSARARRIKIVYKRNIAYNKTTLSVCAVNVHVKGSSHEA